MLRIRQAQMRAIADAIAMESGLADLVEHLRRFAPLTAEVAGDDGLRRVIREGVERARPYKVTNPGLLRFYIELMLHFGHHFDTDPLHPWASAILRGAGTEADRIGRLFDAHESYLRSNELRGTPKSSVPMLRALGSLDLDRLAPSVAGHVDATLAALWSLDPGRCDALGERMLRDHVARAPELAAACGMATDRGLAVVPLFSFVLGHGFATEPMHPWIGTALTEARGTSADHRVTCVIDLTTIFVRNALRRIARTKGGPHVHQE